MDIAQPFKQNDHSEDKQPKPLTTSQKVKKKINELKRIEKIEKEIASFEAKIDKLRIEKRELEVKCNLD